MYRNESGMWILFHFSNSDLATSDDAEMIITHEMCHVLGLINVEGMRRLNNPRICHSSAYFILRPHDPSEICVLPEMSKRMMNKHSI